MVPLKVERRVVRALPLLVAAMMPMRDAWGKQPVDSGTARPEPAPPVLANAPGTNELQDFIFSKMKYDQFYFQRIAQVKARGSSTPGLTAEELEREAERAQTYLPVLDQFFKEVKGYDAGQPFQLPPSEPAFRVYTNLIAILNLFQAFDRKNFQAAIDYGARVVIDRRENLGRFRGNKPEYYVALYRHFFYLMSVACYNLGQQELAVSWLSRTTSDADLQALQAQLQSRPVERVDERVERLVALKDRPLAISPLGNLERTPADDWIGPALAEVLAADLSRHSDFFIVERGQIAAVQSEMRLSQLGITNDNEATQMGKMLNAGSLLVGSYRVRGKTASFQLRLLDADDGQILGAAEGEVAMTELVFGVRKLAIEILSEIGWLDTASGGQIAAARAPRSDTLRDLVRARLLVSTNADEARQLYARAVREDPAYANLFLELRDRFAGLAATVGILPFVNISGDDADQWMAAGVVEALTADLPKLNFTVVERARLGEVSSAQARGSIIGTNAAQEIGRKAGADFVVLGSVLHQKPQIRIDVRFVEVETGVIATACSAENQNDDLMKALATLSAELARLFNEPLAQKEAEELLGNSMSVEALERLIREQHAKESLPKVAAVTVSEEGPFDVALEFGGYLLLGMGADKRFTLMERVEASYRFARVLRAGLWGILFTPTGPIETDNNAPWNSTTTFTGGYSAGLALAYSPIFAPGEYDVALEAGVGMYQPRITVLNPTSPTAGEFPRDGFKPDIGGSLGVAGDYYFLSFLSGGLAFRVHWIAGQSFRMDDGKTLKRNGSGLSTTLRVTARF